MKGDVGGRTGKDAIFNFLEDMALAHIIPALRSLGDCRLLAQAACPQGFDCSLPLIFLCPDHANPLTHCLVKCDALPVSLVYKNMRGFNPTSLPTNYIILGWSFIHLYNGDNKDTCLKVG